LVFDVGNQLADEELATTGVYGQFTFEIRHLRYRCSTGGTAPFASGADLTRGQFVRAIVAVVSLVPQEA
jgi:hypothetical protein